MLLRSILTNIDYRIQSRLAEQRSQHCLFLSLTRPSMTACDR